MKISAVSSSMQGLTTIILEHAGMTSQWDVSSTYSTRASSVRANEDELDPEALFAEINSYWATLSPERQQGIWEVYEDIRKIFESDYELGAAIQRLRQKVALLYQFMPMAELQHHLNFHAVIDYPSSVHDKLDKESSIAKPDSTYLRSDYFGLVSLAVAFRPMIPIWGPFIEMSKRDIGNNYKEYRAFGLLHNTHLIRSPEVARLQEFVEAKVGSLTTGDRNFTTVMGGLGTEELPAYLTAMTCVRRLATATVSGLGDKVNLIARVHFFVNSKMNSLDRDWGRKFGGRIAEKKLTGGQGEDSNTSLVEMYKIKPDLNNGEITMFNVYAEDPYRLREARAPELDLELLEKCLKFARGMDQVDMHEDQKWLVKWVVDPVIAGKAVDLLLFEPLRECMAFAQAFLWDRGYFDMAAMITSMPQELDDDIVIGTPETRQRIQKEQLQEMEERSPYHLPVKRGAPVRQANTEARGVDRLADVLSRNDWQLTAPPELMEKTSRVGNSKVLLAPPDLKIQLSNLLTELYKERRALEEAKSRQQETASQSL